MLVVEWSGGGKGKVLQGLTKDRGCDPIEKERDGCGAKNETADVMRREGTDAGWGGQS